ncbi:MAG: class II aldolase/adducin family protein [Rhodospirillales bacterium]|nr:class II aldolase/adducin family protein [Rhodospirillales bacterium]
MTVTAVRDFPDSSLRSQVSEDEWRARVDLAAAYRLAHLYGWTTSLIFNHISARIPGTDHHFLLNPFGLRWDEITASNLVKIDIDGNILDDTPHEINSAGYTIHSAVHLAREDAMCVMHTHTEAGMAVSALEDGLTYTNQDSMMFYGRVAYHDFEGLAFDLSERERLVSDLGDKKVMILRNHGLLTTGVSVADAWVQMFYLEKVCSTQLALQAATASGAEIRYPSAEVCERTVQQYGNQGCGEREWPGLLRQLDQAGVDYQQ